MNIKTCTNVCKDMNSQIYTYIQEYYIHTYIFIIINVIDEMQNNKRRIMYVHGMSFTSSTRITA